MNLLKLIYIHNTLRLESTLIKSKNHFSVEINFILIEMCYFDYIEVDSNRSTYFSPFRFKYSRFYSKCHLHNWIKIHLILIKVQQNIENKYEE